MVSSFETSSTKHCGFVVGAVVASIHCVNSHVTCFIQLKELITDWHCCLGLLERQGRPNVHHLLLRVLSKDRMIERNQVLIQELAFFFDDGAFVYEDGHRTNHRRDSACGEHG